MELFRALKGAGVEEIMTDFLNPYPAVVSRMKAAYRDKIEDRIESVRSRISG